jgi:DNA-binding NarL/FixJ family response regulator
VLELLGEGLGDDEIAARLALAPKAVEHHVASVRSKLGLRDRADAAHAARTLSAAR